jgi:hypothetical protein
MEYDRIREDYF